MNEKQQKRLMTATTEEMSVEPLPGGTFEVKGEYEVDPSAKSCECPDHEYRVTYCKHLLKVLLELEFGNIQAEDEAESERADGTPPRPNVLAVEPDAIPSFLTENAQWVCWEQQLKENKDGTQRWTKVPIDVNGGFAKSNDPDTWVSYSEALEFYQQEWTGADGIGFALADDGNLVGVDLDKCRDPDTGVVEKWAAELVHELDSYTEVSPSGTGLRVFLRGTKPDGANQTDADEAEDIEVYDFGRYLTVTGQHVETTPTDIRADDSAIEWLQSEWLADDADAPTAAE